MSFLRGHVGVTQMLAMCVIFFVAALSFVVPPGYQALHKDHSIILPPLLHRLDQSLFPHDNFAYEILFSKHTIFLDMLEVGVRLGIDIISLLFILTVVFRLLFFAAAYYIAKYFSGNELFSIAALFFVFRGSFSDFLSYELAAVAAGMFFLALYLFKKNIPAIVALVFSFMMHPISGIAFLLWYGLFLFFDKEMPFASKAFYLGLCVLPIALFSLVRGGDVSIFSRFDAVTLQVAQANYPNIFLSSWPLGSHISFVAWVMLGGLLVWKADRVLHDTRKKRALVALIAVPIVLTAAALLGGEVLGVRGIAVLQLYRSLLLLKIVLPIIAGYYTYQSLRLHSDKIFENSLFAGVVVWSIFKENFIFLPEQMLFFVLPLVALTLGFRRSAIAIFVAGAGLAGLRSYHWHDMYSWYFFVATYIVSILVAFLISYKTSAMHRISVRVLFAGYIAVVVAFLLSLSSVTAVSLRPEVWSDQRWMEMCDWVKKNTDRADVFLIEPFTTTPAMGSFRLTCFREPFLIEGEMAGIYDLTIVSTWKHRSDVQRAISKDLSLLSDIVKNDRIDYLMSSDPLAMPSQFPLVFSNNDYFLYQTKK